MKSKIRIYKPRLSLGKKRGLKTKVFVGLSGGVDSSVAASRLKHAGLYVTGVFIKAWHPDFLPCNWKEDRRDAMRVCAKLGIPFITLDLEKEYKKEVVDYMIREYKAGRTPNPDVMCNKEIKFGAFLKYAIKMGADFVATGHYAKIVERKTQNEKCFTLHASRDTNKDQSYFLWTLKQTQLKRIIFPIGNDTKPEVRAAAKKLGLVTAEKKDSQGLCFVGKVDIKDFLSHFIKPKRGEVLDSKGKKIGTHEGTMFLTIGQRHGFIVTNKKAYSKPLYIVSKNIRTNTITVSEINPESLTESGKQSMTLSNINWIAGPPSQDASYEVRLRYRQKFIKAKIKKQKNKWFVHLAKPALGISLGQSLVVYKNGECLGGGVIETST
jgi:tRNA-specific 2-thiouridylase